MAGNGGSPADLTQVGNSGTHAENGVLIAAGPAIARGATCQATSFDVAPTVLAALRLGARRALAGPGTTQGSGRVLQPLLAPEFLASHPLQPAMAEPAQAAGTPLLGPDEERLKQMRAIGYTPGKKQEVPSGGDGTSRATTDAR